MILNKLFAEKRHAKKDREKSHEQNGFKNQRSFIRIITSTQDVNSIAEYTETLIRREFSGKNHMKLGMPIPEAEINSRTFYDRTLPFCSSIVHEESDSTGEDNNNQYDFSLNLFLEKIEHTSLPKLFWDNTDKLINSIKGSQFYSIWHDFFSEGIVKDPYSEDDIRTGWKALPEPDNIEIAMIDFPEPARMPLCYRIYLILNHTNNRKEFITIEKGFMKDEEFICSWIEGNDNQIYYTGLRDIKQRKDFGYIPFLIRERESVLEAAGYKPPMERKNINEQNPAQNIKTPYIPKEHEQYPVLPKSRKYGGEVFNYWDVDSLLQKSQAYLNEGLTPYGYSSYEDYFSRINELKQKYGEDPNAFTSLSIIEDKMRGMNRKEDWSICKYIGEDIGGNSGLHHDGYYYWPCAAEKPRFEGIIDDEEFTGYMYPAIPELWEIITDPTGMAHRTIFEGENAVTMEEYKAMRERLNNIRYEDIIGKQVLGPKRQFPKES